MYSFNVKYPDLDGVLGLAAIMAPYSNPTKAQYSEGPSYVEALLDSTEIDTFAFSTHF